ncbi:hypothetical protein J4558_16775 [Leptolyngbya sp. 15MV]|nr:hypothetical protein J4558_16775 [Leptolyngbya sp. 15MV]
MNILRLCVMMLVCVLCTANAVGQCTPEWQPFDPSTAGVPGTNGTVNATTMWDPDGPGPQTPRLVVGGRFTIAGNTFANNIAVYDPATGNWSALGSLREGGMGGSVFALAVLPSGDLVAGGNFATAGDVSASNIARWNGSSWSALGSGVTGGGQPFVSALAVLPSGDLVAGGSFTTAGGASASRIARWNGSSWSAMMAINPVLFRTVPFDPAADFTPIAHIAEFPFVFVVHPSVPAQTFAEFAAWAKAQPDPVLFASPNPGSQHHLAMEIVAQRLGFRVTHVGFRGGGPATTAMLGGQMLVGSIGLPPLVPHVREGRLRALAISTSTRSPLLPDVPTISEAALPGTAFPVWYGVVGPRGLPPEIVRHVSEALRDALARPDVVQKLAEQGLTARYMPPAAFDAFMATERAQWGTAARASGVVIE